MPTLAEVIAEVRAVKRDFQLFVEIKTSLEDPALSAVPQAVAEATLAELRRAEFLEHTVLVGFDWRGLIHAKRLEPDLRCWFSTERMSRIAADAIKEAGGDGWFRSNDRGGAQTFREARALGLAYGVWTVNQPRDMRALASLGVDAICTDRPDRLRAILDGYSPSNSAVER
jgi:glycerophosphoryl diester phosphodiesterase